RRVGGVDDGVELLSRDVPHDDVDSAHAPSLFSTPRRLYPKSARSVMVQIFEPESKSPDRPTRLPRLALGFGLSQVVLTTWFYLAGDGILGARNGNCFMAGRLTLLAVHIRKSSGRFCPVCFSLSQGGCMRSTNSRGM